MKEKTAQQIGNMKKDYTFGVEVEMNGITRREAAQIAADYFGTRRYENTAAWNGYMTWSAYDQMGREWKFSRDGSIAGPDAEKCELITPILEYSDIELLQGLLRLLRKAGAVSNPLVGAGVHIHVARKEGFSVKDVKNLVNLMAAHEEQIGRAIRIDSRRLAEYCQTIDPYFLRLVQERNPQTMKELEDCWYEGNDADYGTREDRYDGSRYHCLNLHSFFHGHGTIEFRQFQFSNPHDGKKGGIHCGELKAFIQLCLGMCELAHMTKYTSAKPQQQDNEKYALRCWLLRLGFIGDEFKTAREILLRNMMGNAAWRKAS